MLTLSKIAKILGKSSTVYIRSIFTKLLSDEELDVLQVVFKNMNGILTQLYADESQKKVNRYLESNPEIANR